MTPGEFLRLAGLSRLRLGSVMPPPEPPPADLEAPVTEPAWKFRWCRACDVKWHGLPACWFCGRTAAGI